MEMTGSLPFCTRSRMNVREARAVSAMSSMPQHTIQLVRMYMLLHMQAPAHYDHLAEGRQGGRVGQKVDAAPPGRSKAPRRRTAPRSQQSSRLGSW